MLENSKIKDRLEKLKLSKGKVYAPLKYFKGLETLKEIDQRYNRILKGTKTNNYRPFKTDKNKKVKTSTYTLKFYKKFPNAKSLKNKSDVTGIPLSVIKKVYDKGLAAWKTGHRPGASQQAWGYARVHSFLMKGKTYYTADKSLVEEAKNKMSLKNINLWNRRN